MIVPDYRTYTPAGGRYYRSMAYHYVVTYTTLPVIALALLIAVLNPFWFRDKFFRFVERKVNQFASWRDYNRYAVYLGCNPQVWHTLKGDLK